MNYCKGQVLSISETFPQISDEKVAEIAKQYNGILITEDKDFGELIFAYQIKNLSVIFLRYDQVYEQIEKSVLDSVAKYYKNEDCLFITITKTKIRVRKI